MAGLADCPSTGPVDRSSSRSIGPVDRRAQDVHAARLVGRSTGPVDRQRASAIWKRPRSTGRELCSLYPAPVSRESLLSGSSPSRPGSRPVGSTVKNLTVGRSTGRAFLPFPAANRQISYGAIYTPYLSWFLTRILKSKFSSSQVFNTSFQKSF